MLLTAPETGMGFSSFILFSVKNSGWELDGLAEVIKPAFLASSAAKVERTDVIICCDEEEAANLSATSAAMAAAVFLEVSPADVAGSI